MADLDCHRVTTDGVTLVGVLVRTDSPERVTIEPTHEGPIWAPRRQCLPEAGWTEGHWQGIVEPDEVLALGYATPSETGEPPARVADAEPASDDEQELTPDCPRTRPPPNQEERLARGSAVGDPALDEIERRVSRAEDLASRDTGRDAGATVRAVGDEATARDLVAAVEADLEALERLRERIDRLADRAERVPVDTLVPEE